MAVLSKLTTRIPIFLAMAVESELINGPIDPNLEFGLVEEINQLVYFVLTLSTLELALTIVQQCPRGHGFEAWRRLARTLDPKTGSRGLSSLQAIVTVKFKQSDWIKDALA